MGCVPRRFYRRLDRGEIPTVGFDPDFSGDEGDEAGPRRRRRRAWVYPLLALSGCHLLMTGSPVPLWHIERLDHPVPVRAIGQGALVLADGRQAKLPFLKALPKGDPVFARALEHGVEVDGSGAVYGLIDPPRICGNDPVVFYRERVNLSELAGLLNPDVMDDSIVSPERIRDFKGLTHPLRLRRGLPYDVMGQLRRVRSIYESAAGRAQGGTVSIHPDGIGRAPTQ